MPPDTARVLPLDAIDPDHWPNPRGAINTKSEKFLELQGSIAAQGILEPIVVGPPILKGNRRPLIAGWRRYTAAREAKLDTVPVHERPDITTPLTAMRAALAENMAREDMTPLAEATAIAKLMDLGDTQAAAAAALGVSERTARERLRLLTLPAAVRTAIDGGHVPTTAGRQLQVIADVSPKAASALAKQITKGTLRAGALLDPQLTRQALAVVRRESGLVALDNHAQIPQLPLKPAVLKDLKKRARKAAEITYGGDWLDLSPGALGKTFIQEAKDADKLLTIAGEHADTLYLADPEWIERAATTAIERAERRAADRKRENERRQDKHDKTIAQDPAEQARREHERELAAINANAQPFAAAMNAELGQRLRKLRSCKIQGAVARLVLHLTLDHQYLGQVARHGYSLVDPEHRYATCPEAQTYKMLDDDIEGAGTSEGAAAILAGAYIAFHFADQRADGKGVHTPHYMNDETRPLVRAAAEALKVLPERALALDNARREYDAAREYHGGERDRRRALLELSKASRKGLSRDALYERCKQHSSDAHDAGAAVQIWHHDSLDRVLEQLKLAALVDVDETEDPGGAVHRHYKITSEGRKTLKASLPRAPLFPTIDPDSDAEPSADAGANDAGPVLVHVAPGKGVTGDPAEAELQPDRQNGRPHVRKVIYTASRTAAWVAASRIIDLPSEGGAA